LKSFVFGRGFSFNLEYPTPKKIITTTDRKLNTAKTIIQSMKVASSTKVTWAPTTSSSPQSWSTLSIQSVQHLAKKQLGQRMNLG
jgi:hypothetical protein